MSYTGNVRLEQYECWCSCTTPTGAPR
jgi:hypothetical protein